jgi:hypothetical protein
MAFQAKNQAALARQRETQRWAITEGPRRMLADGTS